MEMMLDIDEPPRVIVDFGAIRRRTIEMILNRKEESEPIEWYPPPIPEIIPLT